MGILHPLPGFENQPRITTLFGGRQKRPGIWGNFGATFAEVPDQRNSSTRLLRVAGWRWASVRFFHLALFER